MRVLKTEDCFYVAGGDDGDGRDGGGHDGYSNDNATSESNQAGWSGKDFMCAAAAFSATAVVGALATPFAGAFAGFATQQLCNFSTSGQTVAYGTSGWNNNDHGTV